MGKENINTAEYLKSLENIIQFQSYVLEHIHDDFSVLFNIISKSLGIDAMLTYSCTEAGMVESVVYNKVYQIRQSIIHTLMQVLEECLT